MVENESVADVAFLRQRLKLAIDIATPLKRRARPQDERPALVKMRDIVEAVCRGMAVEAEKNHVSIHVEGDQQVSLNCLREVVERILFNLVLNAVQQIGCSLRKSGQVWVQYGYRKTHDGMEAAVRVYDNGPGIQGYRQGTIFNPGETTARRVREWGWRSRRQRGLTAERNHSRDQVDPLLRHLFRIDVSHQTEELKTMHASVEGIP